MIQLTDEHIDFIIEDLIRRGIKNESLRLNLLDHICILIEKNMSDEDDFQEFYVKTIRTFYKRDLYELESETNLLLYQNNLIMKKAMIISGVCAVLGFVLGSVGKIFLFRFTDFFLFVGFISFVLIFLPLVLIVLLKGYKTGKDLVIYGSGIVAAFLYFLCMLQKCFGTSGSSLHMGVDSYETLWLGMWLAALAIGAFIFVPSYLLSGLKKPELKISTIITSILLVAFIGVQFRLTSLKHFRASPVKSAEVAVRALNSNP